MNMVTSIIFLSMKRYAAVKVLSAGACAGRGPEPSEPDAGYGGRTAALLCLSRRGAAPSDARASP